MYPPKDSASATKTVQTIRSVLLPVNILGRPWIVKDSAY